VTRVFANSLLVRDFCSEALPFANLQFAISGGVISVLGTPWNPELHHQVD